MHSAEDSLKQWLPNGKLLLLSHKMPWRALLTAVKNYNKSLEKLQNFFFKTETKTKTFIFVLEAPRDQDPGLEDYMTGLYARSNVNENALRVFAASTRHEHSP